MPPAYEWTCTVCNKKIELVVPMDHSAVHPDEEKDQECPYHIWKRSYSHAPAKKLGANWGPGKGHYNSRG